MSALMLWLKAWLGKQEGQDLIEYALIVALVVIVGAAGLTLLGPQIADIWGTITEWLTDVNTGIG